jgi:hypothetical protein
MTMFSKLAVGMLVATTGCGTGKNDSPLDAAPHSIAMQTGPRRFTSRGESTEPVRSHPSNWGVSGSYVRDTAGTFRPVQSSNLADDRMVPVGDGGVVYLGIGGPGAANYVVGPSDAVDARNVLVGRDVAYSPGMLTFGGGGLDPWQAGDLLFAIGMNSDVALGAVSTLTPSATSFGPVNQSTSEQVLGSQGDDVWVIQQRTGTVRNELSLSTDVASLHRSDVEQTSAGGDATGTFTRLAIDQVALDVRLSQFAAAADTTVNQLRARLDVVALPYGSPQTYHQIFNEHAFGGVLTAHMAHLDMQYALSDPMLSLPLGNPFPAGWPTLVRLAMDSFPGVYALPGATKLLVVQGLQYVELPLATTRTAPIVPLIGPARGLLVDGKPPGQAGPVSETPTLTWQAPTVGSVSAYVVTLYELSLMTFGQDVQVYSHGVVRLFTTETSVQVVPNAVQAGKSYFYGVTALTGSIDIKSAPHLVHGAFGASTVLSEKFTR